MNRNITAILKTAYINRSKWQQIVEILYNEEKLNIEETAIAIFASSHREGNGWWDPEPGSYIDITPFYQNQNDRT